MTCHPKDRSRQVKTNKKEGRLNMVPYITVRIFETVTILGLADRSELRTVTTGNPGSRQL